MRSHPRGGFTLIELLVVIFIIALLMALLLVAIQAARESSRRTQCRNNLKEVGLALQNYSGLHGSFPVGSQRQGGYGLSWWVGLLPYLDQNNLFAKLDLAGVSNGLLLSSAKNGTAVNGVVLPFMRCPSSTIEPLFKNGAYMTAMPSYVGISGAFPDANFTETRVNNCCVTGAPASSGQISAGGVLIPNKVIFFGGIKDGMSNVIAVGEASGWVADSTGVAKRVDAAYPNSWITGTSGTGTPPTFTGGTPTNALPAWNITTIRHSPNPRTYDATTGMQENRGANNPLTSEHSGGVHVLLCSGSVRFLADTVDLTLFKKLSTRDDGGVEGDW